MSRKQIAKTAVVVAVAALVVFGLFAGALASEFRLSPETYAASGYSLLRAGDFEGACTMYVMQRRACAEQQGSCTVPCRDLARHIDALLRLDRRKEAQDIVEEYAARFPEEARERITGAWEVQAVSGDSTAFAGMLENYSQSCPCDGYSAPGQPMSEGFKQVLRGMGKAVGVAVGIALKIAVTVPGVLFLLR